MTSVRVELGARSYDILVASDLLGRTGEIVRPLLPQPRVFIVTDAHVAAIHLGTLQKSLEEAGIAYSAEVLPPGEQTKDFAHFQSLLETMLEAGCERATTVLALGGGVVGDIAGFAASVLLRGIPYIQIPTTLLAQVDSSVGGKTAIDTRWGKNLIGSFYQPRLVIADIDLLETLPARQVKAGYAEIVKYGLIDDHDFFVWLEGHGRALLAGDAEARREAVFHSCLAKARIVGSDERENGQRALLNLGHTFAHAMETEAGYGDLLLHGEAVSIGMLWAFALSVRLGLCPQRDLDRLRQHLLALGMPVAPPPLPGRDWDAARLLEHMRADKKVKDGHITFILAGGIGQAFVSRTVDPVVAREAMRDLLGEAPR